MANLTSVSNTNKQVRTSSQLNPASNFLPARQENRTKSAAAARPLAVGALGGRSCAGPHHRATGKTYTPAHPPAQ
jgi:hypothetical protein